MTRVRADRGTPSGFTIVELLVVIAIIGALVAILLPAVNGVRDSAARTQNSNNLRQIGVAINSYTEANSTLPPLVKYPANGPRNPDTLKRATSWAFELLPYLEQQNVYDRFDASQNASATVNQVAMTARVETYANPRRREPVATSPMVSGNGFGASLDYAANGGLVMDSAGTPVRLANNPSTVELDKYYKQKFDARFSGPFHHDLAVPPAAVRDGLGNTLAVGDRWIGPPVPTGGQVWNDLAGYAGESLPTIVRFVNPDTDSAAGLAFPIGITETSIYKFGSVKGNDCCFVFLDGHVRWLQYDMDALILQRLGAINDGQPVPPLD